MRTALDGFFRWEAVSGMGVVLSVIIAFSAAAVVGPDLHPALAMGIGLLLGGVLLALLQWQMLVPNSWGFAPWVLMTTLGWAAGLGVMAFLNLQARSFLEIMASGFMAGLIMGILQRYALRLEPGPAVRWVGLTTLSWGGALIFGLFLLDLADVSPGQLSTVNLIQAWVVGALCISLLAVLMQMLICPLGKEKDLSKRTHWFV